MLEMMVTTEDDTEDEDDVCDDKVMVMNVESYSNYALEFY